MTRRHVKPEQRRGSMLILTALFLLVAVTLAGVGFDLGRVFLVRSALLHDAEAAAVAAALALDGTPSGLDRARTAASDFAAGSTVRFGESARGPWAAEPTSPARLRFARVELTGDPRLSMARTVTGQASMHVKVRAVAGQYEVTAWDSGLSPFAVPEGSASPLQWAEDPSPEAARLAVFDGHQSNGRKIGEPAAPMQAIPADALLALRERCSTDTDRDSVTYADYARRSSGNGRRLLPVQVVDGQGKLAGIRAHLAGADGSSEPVGGYLQAGRLRAVADIGYWAVRLTDVAE